MNTNLIVRGHFHFIGIGGIGMSAIALALIKKGYSVSGSDLVKNEETNKLKEFGAIIFDSQISTNIQFVLSQFQNQTINFVISSAIKDDNEELCFCKKNNLLIKHRSEILAMIMKSYITLSIAGSHGKTSTSTFLSTLLELCTHDSSSITGGIIPIYKSNAHIENTKYLVTEIDESDGTINNYTSNIGIINNIDFDHCDHYSNIDEILSSFKQFASNSKKLLINYDCKITRENFTSHNQWSIKEKNNITYSIIPNTINKDITIGKYYEHGDFVDSINIPIPGLHNLSNITAAIAACRMIGVSFKEIKKNIKSLELPKKRFEFRGELNQRVFYDDYAHHPNEIKATIDLARLFIIDNNINKNQKGRLIAIFQPHRFTRVKQFIHEFVQELSKADVIYLTNIFGAGEENIDNINSQVIANLIYKKNKNVTCLKNNYEIKDKFFKLTKENDFILNMGAGDCHKLWSILNNKNT
ncbi:Probable UDP-N-acetylmuramate-alanine ligase [Prochlorococcus marinus str. MIT 9515]|uniref:UDP-N-acetylmuramate--L-alanine ligase n=1 Tax=Prochlorococcus marinus (strain MIT 9515) TaxID=167542 RepID=A2BTW9_PROM5|nr:UDP-N-acetylmuramate--L-alanine ligase [Prochlorococcus marinus]ABM71230.1 Probable UDP-N-acetylmuramate-alanine ligase [Prochlorococcus marinus str. MIT 9515]